MAIYFVTLYAGFWSSPAYLVPPLLVVCWYIDAWLGPADLAHQVAGDPVGYITESIDDRWPRVDATRIAHP